MTGGDDVWFARPQLFFSCSLCPTGQMEDKASHVEVSLVFFSTFEPISLTPDSCRQWDRQQAFWGQHLDVALWESVPQKDLSWGCWGDAAEACPGCKTEGGWNLQAQKIGGIGKAGGINLSVRTYTISYTISYTLLYRIRYRIFVYDIVYLYDIVCDMQWDIVYDIAYDIVYDIAFIVISSEGLQICMSVFLITAFAIVLKLPLQSSFFGVFQMNLCHCTCRLDTCWRTTETLNSPRFMTTLVDRLSLQPHMSPFYQLYTHREAHKGQGHSTFHGVCAMALAKTSSLSPVDIRGRAPYCTQNATVRLTYTHGGSLHSSLVLRPPNWRVSIPIFYVKNVRVSHPSALVTRPKRGCKL